MADEIEIVRTLGLEPEFTDAFVALPKPDVTLYGAAAYAPGRLANVAELEASNHHYWVLVELPQVQFSEDEVEWQISYDGEITIEGQVTPATIFDNKRLIGSRRNRIQLCPTEPWAISFNFPGPVDYWTTQVFFTINNHMEILVRKTGPEAVTSADGLPPSADIGPGLGPGPDDDIVPVANIGGSNE